MKLPSNLFAQIVEESLDGLWLVDINFKTTFVNEIMAKMVGYTQEEVTQMHISDLMTKEDWEDLSLKLASRKEGVKEHHQARFLRKDGSALWVRCACNPLYNDNGDFVGSVGLVSDISELRKDETILQAQRSVFQRLIAGATLEDSLLELLKPVDQLVNNVYSSILLLDDEGRLWKGASINIPEDYNKALNGVHIGPNQGSCGTSAYIKELVVTENIDTDPRWVDYKALAFAHNLHACWSSPIISRNGRVLGTFAMYFGETRKPTEFEIQIVKDMTAAAALCIEHIRLMEIEKKHLKKMDLLSEARRLLSTSMEYENVLRHIPDLVVNHNWASWSFICLKNDDGIYRTISVAAKPEVKSLLTENILEFDLSSDMGLSKAIKENKAFLQHLNPSQMSSNLMNVSDHSQRITYEKLIELNLQSYIAIPLEVRGEVIGGFLLASNEPDKLYTKEDLDFMNEIGRACAIAIDNSLLYRETKRAVKAREDFISVASHELRTPLTSLKMRIDLLGMLIERGKFPKEVHDALSPIVSELRPDIVKFTRLIEVLLDFSKHAGSKLHLKIENCNLSKVITEEVERLRPEFTSHKTELISNIKEKILGECDQVRVQQVVTNLLMNAMKFGNNNPVTINVTNNETEIFIEVKDQGIGISQHDLERIFQPFERAVSEKHFGGLGLGLFITKQIIERHGGKISVKSGDGHGTTFTASLPLKAKN
jgi:PAS domain S-box-containing protein